MIDLFEPKKAVNQPFCKYPDLDIVVDMKREDLLHPTVSGNKLRKLKYNLKYAIKHNFDTILTYGGAYSNHIAATAAAGKILGLNTIGVIRGEELGHDIEKTLSENQTLKIAQANGMQFHFLSRQEYKNKATESIQNLLEEAYGRCYNIPEGGTNALAVRGTQEILTEVDKNDYDIIAVAAGTGGTAAGIVNCAGNGQEVYVFGALKGEFLKKDIQQFTGLKEFQYFDDEIFGGYAKSNDNLINFMNTRFRESEIPLEPIYTGKMMYRLHEMVEQGVIPGKTRILAVHTGGLQGIKSYNLKLAKKGKKTIDYEDQL